MGTALPGTSGRGGCDQAPAERTPSGGQRAGPGGQVPSQTRTPREPLLRLLEWGEPLRSRDTCFRTSAATVLRGQKGAAGDTNTWAVRPGEIHFGPINPFSKKKTQATDLRIHRPQPRGPRLPPSWVGALPTPTKHVDGIAPRRAQARRVTDPSSSMAPTRGPGWPAPWSRASAPSPGGPAPTLPPIQNGHPVPPLLWGFGQDAPASEPQFIHLCLKRPHRAAVQSRAGGVAFRGHRAPHSRGSDTRPSTCTRPAGLAGPTQ